MQRAALEVGACREADLVERVRRAWMRRALGVVLPGGQRQGACGRPQGVLPFNAVSVWGALLLSARWAFLGERFGGMRGSDNRSASRFFLEALLQIVTLRGSFTVVLQLVHEWAPRWPRPDFEQNDVVLAIGDDGVVDLSHWVALAEQQGRGSYASKALEGLMASLSLKGPSSCVDIIQALSLSPVCSSLLSQFV